MDGNNMVAFDLVSYLSNPKNYSEVTPKMSVTYWVKQVEDGEEYLNIYTGERFRATNSSVSGALSMKYLLRDSFGTLRLLNLESLTTEFEHQDGGAISEIEITLKKWIPIRAKQRKSSGTGDKVYLGVFIPQKLTGSIKTIGIHRKYGGRRDKEEYSVIFNTKYIDLGNNAFYLDYKVYNDYISAEEQAVRMLTDAKKVNGTWRYTTQASGYLQIDIEGNGNYVNFDITNQIHYQALYSMETMPQVAWRFKIWHEKGDYVVCENTLGGSLETVGTRLLDSSKRVVNGQVFKGLYSRKTSYEFARTLPLILGSYEGIKIKHTLDMNTIICKLANRDDISVKFQLSTYNGSTADISAGLTSIHRVQSLPSFREDKQKFPNVYSKSTDYNEDSLFYELSLYVNRVFNYADKYMKEGQDNSQTPNYNEIANSIGIGLNNYFRSRGIATSAKEPSVISNNKYGFVLQQLVYLKQENRQIILEMKYRPSDYAKWIPQIALGYLRPIADRSGSGKIVWKNLLTNDKGEEKVRLVDIVPRSSYGQDIKLGSQEWYKLLGATVNTIGKLWNVVEVTL